MNLEMSLHWGIQRQKEQHNKEVMKKALWRAKWFKKQTGGTFLISYCPISAYFNKWTIFYHQHLPYNYSSVCSDQWSFAFYWAEHKGFWKMGWEKEKPRISSGTNLRKILQLRASWIIRKVCLFLSAFYTIWWNVKKWC